MLFPRWFRAGSALADIDANPAEAWNRSNSALHKTPASASRKGLKMRSFLHG
jgi:hypothetical protein